MDFIVTRPCISCFVLVCGFVFTVRCRLQLRPKHIYLNWLEQLEKYGDNVRRIVPCTVPMVCYRPICRKVVSVGAATAAGWRQGAGCLD